MEQSAVVPENTPESFFTVRMLSSLLLRHWKLIVICVILGVVGAFAVTRYCIPKVYQAKATVFAWTKSDPEMTGKNYRTSNITQELYAGAQLVNDYRELLLSRRVQQPVLDQLLLELNVPRENLPPYEVQASYTRNTRVVTILGESRDPRVATLAANATAEHFKTAVTTVLGLNNVQTIDEAVQPKVPFRPRMKVNLILGFLLGAAVGGGLALLLELLDRTIKNPEQAARQLGHTVIGTVPQLDSGDEDIGKGKARPVRLLLSAGDQAVSEAFRMMRTNLRFLLTAAPAQGRVIMFTSSLSGEGKSSCMAALAQATAQVGRRVLLIDGDLRKPMLNRLLEVDRSNGLVSVLSGDMPLEQALKKAVMEPTLDVLPTGPRPPNPSEMLMSEAFRNLVEECRKNYDYIFIDAPPCLLISDPLVIGQLVDGAVFVVSCGSTRIEVIQKSLGQLEQAGVKILGVLVNKFDQQESGGYYRYGYYDYHYNYNTPETGTGRKHHKRSTADRKQG